MISVVAIVEGDGEVRALPILLRRLADWLSPEIPIAVPTPIRVRRDRFLNRPEEFRRMLLLAAAKCGGSGWILVLLDADDDCPAELAADILSRAGEIVSHRRVSVVLANREYEAWFLAAAASLNGQRGFSTSAAESVEAERHRGAKEWVKMHMASGRYDETTDQPAFTARMNLEQAHAGSGSFRKLCREWRKQVGDSPKFGCIEKPAS